MTFKFSLLRTLTAFAVGIVVYLMLTKLGSIWLEYTHTDSHRVIPFSFGTTGYALFGGISNAFIVLIVRKQDIRRAIRTYVACGCGIVFGAALSLLFVPAVYPPGRPGDEIFYPTMGIVFGISLAVIYIACKGAVVSA